MKKKLWYKVSERSKEFYTNRAPTYEKYFKPLNPIGDATPKELFDFLTNNKKAIYSSSGLFYKVIKKGPRIELPSGVYSYSYIEFSSKYSNQLFPIELREDLFIETNSIYNQVTSDIKRFLENEAIYKDNGALYKKGILLYGPPGTGKTSLIRHIIKTTIPKDAIVIFLGESLPSEDMIVTLKKSLKDRLKVFVFEEITHHTEDSYCTKKLLTFLDGEESLNNCLTIATTNYPENLPLNIADRESRFDQIYKIDFPNSAERLKILSFYLKREPSKEEMKDTSGLSFAAIKEAVFFSILRGVSLIDSLSLTKDRKQKVKKAFSESKALGIGRGEESEQENREDAEEFFK